MRPNNWKPQPAHCLPPEQEGCGNLYMKESPTQIRCAKCGAAYRLKQARERSLLRPRKFESIPPPMYAEAV